MATILFEIPQRVEQINQDPRGNRLKLAARLAGYLHDVGKQNGTPEFHEFARDIVDAALISDPLLPTTVPVPDELAHYMDGIFGRPEGEYWASWERDGITQERMSDPRLPTIVLARKYEETGAINMEIPDLVPGSTQLVFEPIPPGFVFQQEVR